MIRSILIDFKRTVYDPDADTFVNGAEAGLKDLKALGLHIKLVGKGDTGEITAIIERIGIRNLFDDICIDDDKEKFFERITNPAEWLVIGDRARKEIKYGAERGMTTLWFKNGKFADEAPEEGQRSPDHTVDSWNGVMTVVHGLVSKT